jgi:Phytanoyl-CoA dioxygenase (PhyH)
MDMASALAGLGATGASIDARTRERLDRDGYAPLPGVLSVAQLTSIRARLAELLAAEGDQAGLEVHQEDGADRLSDLVNKGAMFDPCGLQPLRADYGGPVWPGEFQVCNSVWLLDDFTADNGATRVVPGSHKFTQRAREALADPAAPHLDEVRLIAPAGTVVVFNSHVWHGGTMNHSDRPRRALHSYFTRRANGQQLDQKKYARPPTLARLSPAARFVLDV